jgi:hypothetical protein
MKIKEWNLRKNIPAKEMGIIVTKAEKRAREESKETVFLQSGVQIPTQKIARWKRRKIHDESNIKLSCPRKLLQDCITWSRAKLTSQRNAS